MHEKTYSISGMHCASCEILLERELKKIKGVTKSHSNHKKGKLIVQSDSEIPLDQIRAAVEACDLKLSQDVDPHRPSTPKNTWYDYLEMIVIFLVVSFIAVVIGRLELARFFPDLTENVGVIMALILGVVASLSTCLIMVGGIVLSYGSMVSNDRSRTFTQKAQPHFLFHIGRVGAFILFGGLLGLLGSKITYSVTFTGYLTMIVAVVMIYIGLQILNIVPSITRLGFHLPKKLIYFIDHFKDSDHPMSKVIVGAFTFLLPCGFTQSMQLAAVASGSFSRGALIMGAFALGTFPVLFSLGLGSSVVQKGGHAYLKKTIGVIILLFGLYSINSGMVLAGSSFNLTSGVGPSSDIVQTAITDDIQVVHMKVDWVYEPTEFKVKKGVPVRWEIEGINVSGCTNEVIIPKLGISKKIEQGLNVVEFTPQKTGTLPFSCWMGMANGRFIVTD